MRPHVNDCKNVIKELNAAKKTLKIIKDNFKGERKFLQVLLSTMSEGVDIVDKNLNIVFMSQSFLRIFGKKSIGKKCYQVYKDNEKQCADCPLRKSIKIGETRTIIASGVAGGRIFEINHTGIKLSNGKKGALEVFRDVTEKKKFEEMLRKSEEKYKTLFESSRDAIMTLEPPTWKFTSGNPSTIEMFECKDEKDFTSRGPWQYSPENQPDGKPSNIKAKEMIMKAMKEGSNFFEWTHKRLNGEEFPATVLLTRTTVGGKIFLQATVRDITEEKKTEMALEKAHKECENLVIKRTAELSRSNEELKKEIAERKKIEDELRASEKKFRTIFEGSMDGILAADTKTKKFVFANPRICELTGYTEKELFKLDVMAIHPKKDLPYVIDQFSRQARGEIAMAKNLPVLRKDKSIIYCDINSIPLKINDRELLVGTFRDITERKKAEEALNESERHYRSIVEDQTELICRWLPNGKLIFVNEAYCNYFNKKETELIGKKFTPFIPKEDRKIVKNISGMISIKNSAATYEHRVIKPNGEIRWQQWTDRGIFDTKSKNPIEFQSIGQDITERKRAEEQLRFGKENALNEQKKLEVILQSIGDGLFVLDKDKKIMLVNKATEKLSGYTQKELIGKKYTSYLKFLSEKDKKPNTEFVDEIYNNRAISSMPNSMALIRKDKKNIPVSNLAAPLKDKANKVIGCVVVFRDVAREREIDQMKSEFVSVASHQLRTPLTGIKWFVQLLMNENTGRLNEEQKDFVQQIFISNERMIHLVEDLLNVSHIETGKKFNIVKEHVNLVALIKGVVANQMIIAGKKKIKIKYPSHCPAKAILPLDAEKIYQVFYNLLDNAIKYSKEKGVIHIGCEHGAKDEIITYVKDEGLGIPANQHKRMFQKFFRADNVMSSETSGSGLGLYIIKAVVEAHGGRIWFESTQNKGATFYVALPTKGKK